MDKENKSIKEAMNSGKEEAKRQAKKIAKKAIKKAIVKAVKAAVKAFLVAFGQYILIALGAIILLASIIKVVDISSKNKEDESEYKRMTNIEGLADYIRQFSHVESAPQSSDGNYYLVYNDTVGWATIGNADLQLASHISAFDVPGKVLENGKEKEVESLADYMNEKLGGDATIQFTPDYDIEALGIYIEKGIVDSIGESVQYIFYNVVLDDTNGLELSKQQLYALTVFVCSWGHMPTNDNGQTFKEVYEDGARIYDINSWEHNRYIWDNWWSSPSVIGGYAGHVKGRDAQFETYVKGVFLFDPSIFSRTEYTYFTQEQIDNISYAPSLVITRDPSDEAHEEDIFSYEANDDEIEFSGETAQRIMSACEWTINNMISRNVHYSLTDLVNNNIVASSRHRCICCATYTSIVLYKAGVLTEEQINQYSYNWTGSGGVPTMLQNAGWKQIDVKDAMAGDVVVNYTVHVIICAGGDYYYDNTCACVSSTGTPPTGAVRTGFNQNYRYSNNSNILCFRAP